MGSCSVLSQDKPPGNQWGLLSPALDGLSPDEEEPRHA